MSALRCADCHKPHGVIKLKGSDCLERCHSHELEVCPHCKRQIEVQLKLCHFCGEIPDDFDREEFQKATEQSDVYRNEVINGKYEISIKADEASFL